MKMSNDKIDIDMALPMNMDAVNDYYRNNKIRKTSFSSSTETISSTNSQNFNEKAMELVNVDETKRQKTSNDRSQQLITNDVSASTSTTVDDVSKYTTSQDNIKAVNVCDSSDVHFGNKHIYYNGPITVKQKIVLKDEEGVSNKGFEGSQYFTNSNGNIKTPKSTEKTEFLNFRHKSLLVIALTVLLLSIIGSVIYYKNINRDPEIAELDIISRKAWNASEPKEILAALDLPVTQYIIAHTVTSECFAIINCSAMVWSIQQFHMYKINSTFDDIGYNFLIGGDGNVYEGRGWKFQGAHTSGYNRISIGVAFIGNFVKKLPNEKQIKAGLALFDEGVRVGAVTPDYKIYGALQMRNTQSPGDKFYNEVVTKWKHWEAKL